MCPAYALHTYIENQRARCGSTNTFNYFGRASLWACQASKSEMARSRRTPAVAVQLAGMLLLAGEVGHTAAFFISPATATNHPRPSPQPQLFSSPFAKEVLIATSHCRYRSNFAADTCRTPPSNALRRRSTILSSSSGSRGSGSSSPGNGGRIPATATSGSAQAISGGRVEGEGSSARELEWEGEAGAAWTEFEDWLLQDTYSRYAIGSGKHVLWRRMVREVPELVGRTPQEVRQRWLRLTGRLGGSGGGELKEERGEVGKVQGSPALDAFYLQPPVLEQWEEIVEGEGMGSFRGQIFGQRGLADGTVMTTAPIDASGKRIQDQYVATQCGVVYELGESRETSLVGQASSTMLKVAPTTVLALAGALYALTALSHHVQVEVFVI